MFFGYNFNAHPIWHTKMQTHTHTHSQAALAAKAEHTFGHNECAATFLMVPTDNNKLLLALNESH